MAYLKQDMFDEALKDAEAAIELDPNFVKGYWRKCEALLKLNRPKEAEVTALQACNMDPTNREIDRLLMDARIANRRRQLAGVWEGQLNGIHQRISLYLTTSSSNRPFNLFPIAATPTFPSS